MKKIVKTVVAGLMSLGSAVCAAQSLTVCASTSYTIPSAEGVSIATYKWLENGAEIPGANGESYTDLEGKPAGTYVYVRMAYTDACGWQNSNAFIVYVAGTVAAPEITAPAAGCAGSDYVFTVPTVDGVSYDWAGGGTPSSNSYTYSDAAVGALTVTVRAFAQVNGVTCNSAASTATVTAYTAPVISAHPAGTSICLGSTATLSVVANNVTAYQWKKDGANVTDGSGGTSANYTTAALTTGATYSVIVTNGACSTASSDAVVAMDEGCCHAPGVKDVTFADFNPCAGAPYGSSYTLTDARDQKTYKVKLMPDDRYWMVQDLVFGDKCEQKTSISASTTSGNIHSSGTYYGDCRTRTMSAGGYLYNRAAVTNTSNLSTVYPAESCTGTATALPGAKSPCQGICPDGWHLPSHADFYNAASTWPRSAPCIEINCLQSVDQFNPSFSGWCTDTQCGYVSSTANHWSADSVQELWLHGTSATTFSGSYSTSSVGSKSIVARCLKNY